MVKQKGCKAAAAAARATKDKQFKALQQDMGLSSDKDGEESAPINPQKAATWCLVVQSPQQGDGGASGKQAAQVDPDPSSLVPIPTLPLNSLSLVPHSSGLAGQDARSAKLPVSPSPSGSTYIKSPPCRPSAVLPASLQDVGLGFHGN
jgi:hypothetical protein